MANSEPPAKLSPVNNGTSKAENPFCAACVPKTSAKGIIPSSIGIEVLSPRTNSLNSIE
jgi:hypothetical protein